MKNLQPISLEGWDERYAVLSTAGLREPPYGGPLRRHLEDGDQRLQSLMYDPSPAALNLWNFLLTEEARLHQARADGHRLIGAMKDLGTVPVMACAVPDLVPFYPDGAWWTPCLMEFGTGMLEAADRLGVDDSFCPVRAMLGAFVSQAHFPIPDLLICSVGATCDDFSAIAQRLEGMGFPIFWWEIPHRRPAQPGHRTVRLPGGRLAAREQVQFVRGEMERIRDALQAESTCRLDTPRLREGIRRANRIRRCLRELRRLVFTADRCPMPALEMLIAEMLIIHFCSDIQEAEGVLQGLLAEVRRRIHRGQGFFDAEAVRVFWVNPVADLRAMNWLESSGGRICGTDYLFTHALDDIPDTPDPLESLARSALADPMVGSATERAQRIVRDARHFRAEAVVISRIPGASHCAYEGTIIADRLAAQLDIPVVEMEISPVSDALQASLNTRLCALIEAARARRAVTRRQRRNRQPKGER